MYSLYSSFKITFCLIIPGLTALGQHKDGQKLLKLTIPEEKNITIKGNIRQFAPRQGLLDEYAFQYVDMVTGKEVIIPISKDTAGNFSVSFPVNGYQEVQLSQGVKMGDEIKFSMYFMSRFFVKPGEDMVLDYKLMKDYTSKSTFKGNMANANSQQDAYYNSLHEALGSADLVPLSMLDSIKPGGYAPFKRLLTGQLKKVLDFNARYFKQTKSDPFLKKQLDLESKYLVGRYLLMALRKAKEKDPDLLQFLDSIGIPLNNPEAYGNLSYKYFLSTYFIQLGDETFAATPNVTILLTDMASYLLKEHIEFSEDEKVLCRKILDTVNKASEAERTYFLENYMGRFDDEYLITLKTKMTFDHIVSAKNPFVNDVFLTRLLRERLDNNQLVNINSLISRYKTVVRENPVKAKFLKDYQLAYNRLYKSTLSPRSVLNDAKTIPANGLVKSILDRHKGKVVYIDIWATWCAPCIFEMGNSKKMREQFIGKDVVFLYLCISSPTESTWQNLIAGHDIEGEHYFLSNVQSAELAREFNINMIPRYLIVDKDGSMANAVAGKPSGTKTAEEIKALLLR